MTIKRVTLSNECRSQFFGGFFFFGFRGAGSLMV